MRPYVRVGLVVLGVMLCAVYGMVLAGALLPANPEIAYVSRRGGDSEIFRMDIRRMISANLTNTVYWYPGIPGAQDQSPAWSPDGEWIAFQSTRAGNEDIWLMDANGNNLKQLTTNPMMDMHPAWSPDGCCLVYQSWQNDGFDVVMIDLEAFERGEPPTLLTTHGPGNRHPAFNATGTGVIFASSVGNPFDAFELFTLNLDDNALRELSAATDGANALHPSYSPDGQYILYDGFGEGESANVFMMRTEGVRTPRRVIGTPDSSDNRDAYFPTWSPDGSHILYVSSRERDNSELFIVPVLGEFELGTPRQLTFNTVMDIHPVMRPR